MTNAQLVRQSPQNTFDQLRLSEGDATAPLIAEVISQPKVRKEESISRWENPLLSSQKRFVWFEFGDISPVHPGREKKSNEENHIDKGGRATEAILLGHEKGMDRSMVSLELLIDKKVFERVQKNHAHKRLAKTNAQIADNPHKILSTNSISKDDLPGALHKQSSAPTKSEPNDNSSNPYFVNSKDGRKPLLKGNFLTHGSQQAWTHGSQQAGTQGNQQAETQGNQQTMDAWKSASVDKWKSAGRDARQSADVDAWQSAGVGAWKSTGRDARQSAGRDTRQSTSRDAWQSAGRDTRQSASVDAWKSTSRDAWKSAGVDAK